MLHPGWWIDDDDEDEDDPECGGDRVLLPEELWSVLDSLQAASTSLALSSLRLPSAQALTGRLRNEEQLANTVRGQGQGGLVGVGFSA